MRQVFNSLFVFLLVAVAVQCRAIQNRTIVLMGFRWPLRCFPVRPYSFFFLVGRTRVGLSFPAFLLFLVVRGLGADE